MTASFDLEPWRKLLDGVTDDEARFKLFEAATMRLSEFVPFAMDRAAAADMLHELAAPYQLDADQVQIIIADHLKDKASNGHAEESGVDWERLDRENKAQQSGQKAAIISEHEFVAGFTPPDYLIEGILQRRFIYALTGQTGHAKTAVALLVARLVATGEADFGGKAVERGHVLYFVGENPDDVRMRVIGKNWLVEQQTGKPAGGSIFYAPGVFSIKDMVATIERHCGTFGPLALIVIDTSAAYFLGQDENSNPQLGEHARTMRELTKLPGGPCVIVLCHPSKHAAAAIDLLPRGGGAFLAEMDGNLTLWRVNDKLVELDYTKLRGPGFQPISFEIASIRDCPALRDVKGRALSTVHAVAITQQQADRETEALGADADLVLKAKLATADASMAEIAMVLGWRTGGEPDKKRVQRVLRELAKEKFMRSELGKYVLTEKGRDRARNVALKIDRDEAAGQGSLTFN